MKNTSIQAQFDLITLFFEIPIISKCDCMSKPILCEYLDSLHHLMVIFEETILQINEIIIDSTFKTNQEKFGLFAVIINCAVMEFHLHRNTINSRVKVLEEFFLQKKWFYIAFTFACGIDVIYDQYFFSWQKVICVPKRNNRTHT